MLIFAPLKNFSCEGKKINLDNNLRIVKFPALGIEKIKKAFEERWIALEEKEIKEIENHFNLCREVQVEKSAKAQQKAFDESRAIFDQVINALTLFKEGGVWFDAVYSIDPLIHQPPIEERPEAHKCNLTRGDIPHFKEWWKKFWKVLKQNKRFRRAIERFSQSLKRTHTVDYHLVDYIIGLEALFSTGLSESRHKVCRRASVFLRKKRDERIKIYRELKKAYDLRSKIVHGEEIDFEEIKYWWIKTRDYLKECLRKIVEEEQYHQEALLSNLDFDF